MNEQGQIPDENPLRLWFLGLVIAAATWAAYGDSLAGPFFFDDDPSIADNPTIQHLGRLGAVLSPPTADGRGVGGRPVVNLSLALNYAFGGTEVRGYHLANVGIHLLAGLTLFGVLRRTRVGRGVGVAFAIALLWTLHPLQTESVTSGAWFFAILAPSSSIVPLVTQTIAEHRMYLPLAAVITLGVLAVDRLARRQSAVFLGCAAVAAGVLTARRNHDYRSEVAIWADTVAKLPDNRGAHNNLANALAEAGRIPEARAEYEAALRLRPDDPQAHYNLGNLLLESGRADEAIPHYEAAARADPTLGRIHNNFGLALLKVGNVPEAIRQFVAAVEDNPTRAETYYNLANALVRRGDLVHAVVEYRKAIQLRGDFASAHFNLGQALAELGRMPEAIAEYREVLRLNPAHAKARYELERAEAALRPPAWP